MSDIRSPVSPASVKRVPKTGDLLMIWNNHANIDPNLRDRRTPLICAISRDEGKTWIKPRDLESDSQGWFCYTAIEFIDDRVLLAYCAGPRPRDLGTTRITTFSLDWLYADPAK